MGFYFKQYFYQRKKHYLSIVSLTISLVLTVCMKNICSQIKDTIGNFYHKQGLDINCVIVRNDKDDFYNLDAEAVKCLHGLYGENEIIITTDTFYNLFDFDYYLYNSNEGITVSFDIYKDNNYREQIVINGTGFTISRVLSQSCSNIFFDCSNIIIFPENHAVLFKNTVIRYYYDRNICIQADEESYELLSQESLKKGLDAVAAAIEVLLNLISAISITAAIISQSNHSLLLLENNRRFIGIKKANGASNEDIGKEILFENIVTAFLADILAIGISEKLLGATDAAVTYFSMFKDSLFMIIIVILLSCAIPVLKCQNITIVDSIRKEN